MKPLRVLAAALLAAGLLSPALAQVRPEVGKPLQEASDLIKAGKGREALAKVRQADAVPNKSAAEQNTIERMRAAAAQRAGDTATAIQAFEAVYPKLSDAEKGQVAESLAFAYSQQKNTAKATEWANRAQQLGRNSTQLRELQAYLQTAGGDYSAILKQSTANVAAAEQAGKKPDEDDLLRMADAARRTNANGPYAAALEKLVVYYGKKDYWTAHLARLQRKPGFSDRLAVDVLRLKLQHGLLTTADEYMELAQLALQAGLPAEGQRIVERGFASGVLGKGDQGERHKRLKDLADKQAQEASAALPAKAAEAAKAKTGDALVQAGAEYVSMGQVDKGIALIEQGIAKGGLKRPEDAKLRLGLALLQANKKPRAVQVLRSVGGNDGTADIARLWAVTSGGAA